MGVTFTKHETRDPDDTCAECHLRLPVPKLGTCNDCSPSPLEVLRHLLRERGTTFQAVRDRMRMHRELIELRAPATTMQAALHEHQAFDRELFEALRSEAPAASQGRP
jgi:hypothetical protein